MVTSDLPWGTPHYTAVNYVLMVLSVLCVSSIVLGVLFIYIREARQKGGKKRQITKVLPALRTSNNLVVEDLDYIEGTPPLRQSFVESTVRSNVRSLKSQRSLASVSGNKKMNHIKSVHSTM